MPKRKEKTQKTGDIEAVFDDIRRKYPDYVSLDLAGAIDEGAAILRRDEKKSAP